MRYKDVVKFNDSLFFGGSIEIDCIFENRALANKAAESYIFHSKKSFTTADDGKIDTISFTKFLFETIYGDNLDNQFFTAIAGYGSGKSHFCTALAALLANNDNFLSSKKVLENIEILDSALAKQLNDFLMKPNIVFALNGMNDFNLSIRMYEQLKDYLKISNISIPLFTRIDAIYTNAIKFITSNFVNKNFQNALLINLKKIEFKDIEASSDYLINHIKDNNVFNLINLISSELTGNEYIVENYLNPKVILDEICQNLCGENKPFDKIIVIFDEIGRYIEWLGSNRVYDPSIMQQLFEGIKNSNGKATFLSLIQFPLSTYFSHLAPSAYTTIARYIDRYKTARNFHLSSVLESVFANLVDIKNCHVFSDYSESQKAILSWQPELNNYFIWSDKEYFKSLICNKLAAFHPITISLLAKLSEFTQKRGPMMILRELLENNKNHEISAVSCIFPVSVFDTQFKSDILKMEEHGILKSDNVSIYNRLINKPSIKRQLTANDKAFLQAIVIINLLSLKPISKSDYLLLLENLTGIINRELLLEIEEKLEYDLGIIQFDDDLFFHHIVLNAIGRKDFDQFFRSKRNEIQSENDYTDPEFLNKRLEYVLSGELNSFKTYFASVIPTLEWVFNQTIINIQNNLSESIKYYIDKSKLAITPDLSKGSMVWVYINCSIIADTELEMQRIINISKKLNLDKHPIQIGFILDTDAELFSLIIDYDTLDNLAFTEKEKYASFISSKTLKISTDVKNCFIGLRKDAYYFIDNCITKSPLNYKRIVNNRITSLYPYIIPFKFDGFSTKTNHHARREYFQILKFFTLKSISVDELENFLTPQAFNRAIGLLGDYGWKIFEQNILTKPSDPKVRNLFDEIDSKFLTISDENSLSFSHIFNELLSAPYGLNIYSAIMLLTYNLSFYRDRFIFKFENNTYVFKDWINLINKDNKINILLINKTIIEYCDPEMLRDSTFGILQETLETHSLEEVIAFSERVDDYVNKYDYDDEIVSKIELVKTKVYDAERIKSAYELIESKIDDALLSFHDLDDGTVEILKLYNELDKNWDQLNKLIKTTSFQLPKEWSIKYESLIDDIVKYINENFESWFNKNNWPKNHNVEGFNSFCKKISKTLYSLGINEYGRIVNDTVKRVSASYEYLSKCQARIADYQNRPIPVTHYECKEYDKGLEEFIKEIRSSSELFKGQKEQYVRQLDEVHSRIKKHIDSLNENLVTIYDILSTKEFSELDELESFITDIKFVVNAIYPSHSDYKIMEETLKNAEEIFKDLSNLKQGDYLEIEISTEMKNINKKFKDNIENDPDYIYCKKLFTNVERILYEKLCKKIESWMSVLPIENITTLSKSKLEQIYNYISNPPVYLRESELSIISKLKKSIVSSQDKSLEDSIIRLFKSIKDVKKKEIIISKLKNLL